MELESMLTLIQAVSNSELTCFSLETNEMKLTLEKKKELVYAEPALDKPVEAVPSQVIQKELKQEEKKQMEKEKAVSAVSTEKQWKGEAVKSPLVGTFYSSPSPEEEPFVKVGDTVKKGQVLGLIEAMKLMNEIEAEKDGVIEAILVENEQMVEYGQELFRII